MPLNPKIARAMSLFALIMKHSKHHWEGSFVNKTYMFEGVRWPDQYAKIYNLDTDESITVTLLDDGDIDIRRR